MYIQKNNQSKNSRYPDDFIVTCFYTGLMVISEIDLARACLKEMKTVEYMHVKCMQNCFLKVIERMYLIFSTKKTYVVILLFIGSIKRYNKFR